MSIKLISIDIDGTLVNDHEEITPLTEKALKTAKENGVKLVITTGRPLHCFQQYLDKLGINHQDDQYVVDFNGSLIQTTSGKTLMKKTLTFDEYRDIELYARRRGIRVYLTTPECMYTSNEDISQVAIEESAKLGNPIRFRTLDELERMKDDIVPVKAMMLDSEPLIDKTEKELTPEAKSRFSILRSEYTYLEWINKTATKEAALQELIDKLGIKRSEVMSLGNGYNDIGCIKLAGIGVAMKGSAQAVLDSADYIADDCNHDGVGKAVDKFVNNK